MQSNKLTIQRLSSSSPCLVSFADRSDMPRHDLMGYIRRSMISDTVYAMAIELSIIVALKVCQKSDLVIIPCESQGVGDVMIRVESQ